MDDRPEETTRRVADAMIRGFLWLAHHLLLGWWFLWRPRHDSAVVAVWLEERILMIRHSYRAALNWPGGGIEGGEHPAEAAARELREELGLDAAPGALALIGEVENRWEYRVDRLWIFELRLQKEPHVTLDRREVVAASFMAPSEAIVRPLPPYIRDYFRERGFVVHGL